jgi:DNA-binding GntR family transcriptional regulator
MLSENGLATEFGISRTPIRRVLQRLEFEGLVVSLQGVGTMVTTVDLRLLKEVYAFRIRLAELIGELSYPPSPDIDLSLFDSLLEQCEQMYGQQDYNGLARINMAFNDALVSFITNKPLREVSNQLYYQTARVWPQILPEMDWPEEVTYMCDEIKAIAKALGQGDMRRVGEVRRQHIAQSLSRIQRYLGEGDVH